MLLVIVVVFLVKNYVLHSNKLNAINFCSSLLYIQLGEPPKSWCLSHLLVRQSKKAFFGIIFSELTEVCLFLSVLQAKKVDHNFVLYMYLSLQT